MPAGTSTRGRGVAPGRLRATLLCCLLAGTATVAASCSDGTPREPAASAAGSSTTTTSPAPRPAGPAADLQELTGGNGVSMGSPVTVDLTGPGYVQNEYAASGTATSYRPRGALTRDGRWTFQPADSAAYRTRVLVRRPADTGDVSGTVVVEWLNVSSGVDSDVEWYSTHEELTRHGDIWVGVSAQRIGVMGGDALTPAAAGSTTTGLRGADPARYGSLDQPGDGYAFDIFTQVARAVRAGGVVTGGSAPKHLLAAGESQSAFAMVTYINGVQPLTRAFDGFLVHSRGGGALPLVGPGQPASLTDPAAATPALVRADTGVPVLDVQTEGDLTVPLNSLRARQDDSDRFRLWEVAGAAHADAHTLGPFVNALNCGVPVNNAPTHVVVKAAIRALDTWVRTGTPPPTAPRITVTSGDSPGVTRDADGIAEGGIRTPPVAVPVDVLSGVPAANASVLCQLFGSTKPLPDTRVAALYPTKDAYLRRFTAAVDMTVKAGFALATDRAALLAYAQPDRVR
ncbi:alpha/beta hydrolase domain-containing protein [Parafrankia discariae]|uniref:alpha/beta hydrolase domain-containing protein n=1 Tax=Parafrankia discariae TaxID=365528 RepID=UPI00036CFFB2|nr:alpha/beta hydrolase domain-containing protein [Parafrankia discariae]